MSAPVVSVIMPVYNSAQYLPASIGSVLAQTMADFELLLCDDGSTDGSLAICEEFASRDGRIRVFHKENGGVGSARNYAFDRALGEYIAFIDNDDEYRPCLLESNAALADETGADVVRFGREDVFIARDGSVTRRTPLLLEPAVYRGRETVLTNYGAIRACGMTPWSSLYRRSFLLKHNIRYSETVTMGFEDWHFLPECWMSAQTVAINPVICYDWYIRFAHSTSAKYSERRLYDCVEAAENEYALLRTAGILEAATGLWQELKLIYIASALKLMFREGSDYGARKAASFMRDMRTREPFKTPASKADMAVVRAKTPRRAMALSLFDAGRFHALYAFALVWLKPKVRAQKLIV